MAKKEREEKPAVPKEEEVHLGSLEEESLSPEEAQSKIAIMLARTQNLETLSETTEDEVKLISALSTIAEEHNMDMLENYLAKYLQLKVSLHRQGRKEIQEIAKPTPQAEEKAKSSLRQLLLGGRV